MARRLIFVSCGQLRDEEKKLGNRIVAEINAVDGFEAYFADNVQDLAGLSSHIFSALRRASGAIVVMHPRGEVRDSNGLVVGTRASVWINQEVAILAYRQFFENRPIPVLSFADPEVSLEGAMSAFIVNPLRFTDEAGVIANVKRWLANDAPRGATDEDVLFEEKWKNLLPVDYAIVAALIDEGAHDVKRESVRRRLVSHYGLAKAQASDAMRDRLNGLCGVNLVRVRHNLYDGDEMSLHPAWEWHTRHAVHKVRR